MLCLWRGAKQSASDEESLVAFICNRNSASYSTFCMFGEHIKSMSLLLAKSGRTESKVVPFPVVTRH